MRPCPERSQDGNAGKDGGLPAARRLPKERRCSFQISASVLDIPADKEEAVEAVIPALQRAIRNVSIR
jgi:hypothetical protein